ncbi:MAG: site-specific integrase [Spirochaetes bacterium]|nr:site-specific integrase [Spirochaetota bacterium]
MQKYTGIYKKGNRYFVRFNYNQKTYTAGSSFETKAEAFQWKEQKKKELRKGVNIVDSRISLEEYIKIYLRDYLLTRVRDNKIKETSFNHIESAFRNSLVPALGQYRLNELTPKIMQDFKNEISMKYSNYHVKNLVIETKRALGRAVTWKYLAENPAADLEIPKIIPAKPNILTEEQLFVLLQNAPIRNRAAIGLAAFAGLRLSEVLGLQWKYVDLKKRTIRIEYQCYQGTYREVKTPSSVRTIPIIEDLLQILQEWKLQCPKPKKWLFPGHTGEKPLFTSSWSQYNFKPLLKELKLPDVNFHSLRKLCTKLLLDNGIPLREVMAILGHSDPKITLRIYDSISDQHLVRVSKDIRIFDNKSTMLRKKLRI